MSSKEGKFLGTYFDRDSVMRLARILSFLAWLVIAIYAVDLALGLGTLALQYMRGLMPGMGFTDIAQNVLYIIERPVHGIVYFAVLETLSKGLLIFLDVEDNTRRRAGD